jgi:hypothetical protein
MDASDYPVDDDEIGISGSSNSEVAELPSVFDIPLAPRSSSHTDAHASPLQSSSSSRHWTMSPLLNGKRFIAEYRPPYGPGQKSVHATPDYVANMVNIWWGKKQSRGVPPEHIFQTLVKPSTHEQGILIVKGEHTGKYARRIYMKYDKEGKHSTIPWMTLMTFSNWDSPSIVDDYVLVDADDCTCAEIENNKWNELLKEKKMVARKKREQRRPAYKTKKKENGITET